MPVGQRVAWQQAGLWRERACGGGGGGLVVGWPSLCSLQAHACIRARARVAGRGERESGERLAATAEQAGGGSSGCHPLEL